jgi:hypothetical protein
MSAEEERRARGRVNTRRENGGGFSTACPRVKIRPTRAREAAVAGSVELSAMSAVTARWPTLWQACGSSYQAGAVNRKWAADKWVQPNLIFFQYSNSVEICKFKMEVFPYSKNSQILHKAILEYYSQLYKFFLLQIPKKNKVKNPGTDSIFEFSMNFKKVQTFWEKSKKFSKNLFWLDLHKSKFSWAHLYVIIRVTNKC